MPSPKPPRAVFSENGERGTAGTAQCELMQPEAVLALYKHPRALIRDKRLAGLCSCTLLLAIEPCGAQCCVTTSAEV